MKVLEVVFVLCFVLTSSVYSSYYHPTHGRPTGYRTPTHSHIPVGYNPRQSNYPTHYRPGQKYDLKNDYVVGHHPPTSHLNILLAARNQQRYNRGYHPRNNAHIRPTHGAAYRPINHQQHINPYHGSNRHRGGYTPYSHLNILLAAREKVRNGHYPHRRPTHVNPSHVNPRYGVHPHPSLHNTLDILLAARNKLNGGYKQRPQPTYVAPNHFSPRTGVNQQYPHYNQQHNDHVPHPDRHRTHGLRQQRPAYSHLDIILAARNNQRAPARRTPTYVEPAYNVPNQQPRYPVSGRAGVAERGTYRADDQSPKSRSIYSGPLPHGDQCFKDYMNHLSSNGYGFDNAGYPGDLINKELTSREGLSGQILGSSPNPHAQLYTPDQRGVCYDEARPLRRFQHHGSTCHVVMPDRKEVIVHMCKSRDFPYGGRENGIPKCVEHYEDRLVWAFCEGLTTDDKIIQVKLRLPSGCGPMMYSC